ncbi:glucose-methanol-choline (GMC) oxidoreductase family protein [Wolffia australiana]
MALRIALFFLLLGFSSGEEFYGFREASTFLAAKKYDYIIIGGGTAGCPLAATLSKNFSVLVLERGGAPYGNVNVSFMQNFHISLADTSPASASQAFVSTDGVINARARVLGGGTAINAGFYTRANPSFVTRAGWEEELVNESYLWVEKQIVHLPELAKWQEALRDGLLEAGVSPFNGFTYDHLYGTKVGGTIFDKDGYRHTAADLLAAGNPSNLHVLVHATVQRIVFDRRGGRLRAVGVNFKDEQGTLHKASLNGNAKSEVILSAGAIGSPQILLLSGIGPKSDLKKLRIPVVLHNEFVGMGMSDNPMNTVFIPSKKPVEQSLIQTVGITKGGVFIEASSGFGQSSDSIKLHHGILSAEIGQISTLPPKQRTREAIRAFMNGKKELPREAFQGGFLLEKIAGPLSRGHLTLVNRDADANPAVTFNYFKHPHDLRRCVYGVRTMIKIARTKHYADLALDDVSAQKLLNVTAKANVNLIPRHPNDTTSLEQFCRDTVITIWHYHGGCHVGQVVDSSYLVLGVNRLRIVDGSTFPASPGTNPQGTVMMMGRYMGVKMLRERLGRETTR